MSALPVPEPDQLTTLDERYLDPLTLDLLPAQGILAIKSPKGSGKTELLNLLVKRNRRERLPTLLIGHRINLLFNLAARINLNYLKGGGTARGKEIGPYSAVCLNSVAAYTQQVWSSGYEFERFDTLIIDECEQVLQALVADHLIGARNVVCERFMHHVQTAQRIILLDADLSSGLTLEVLRLMRNREDDTCRAVINEYRIGQGRQTLLYADRDHLLTDAITDVLNGEKVFYATNYRQRATTIARCFEHNGKNVLLVTSHTTDRPEVQQFIADPDGESPQYDAVVTSPTLSTGVSIDVPHFTRIYGEFGGKVGTFYDADQALCRVRDEGVPHRAWVQQLKQRAIEAPDVFHAAVDKHRRSSAVLPGESAKLSPLQRTWGHIMAEIKARVSEWSTYKANQFEALRREQGWDIEHVPKDKEAAKWGRHSFNTHHDVTNSYVSDVFYAQVLDAHDYHHLLRERSEKRDDKLAMARYRYAKALSDIDVELSYEEFEKAIEAELLRSLRWSRTYVASTRGERIAHDLVDRKYNKTTFTDADTRQLRSELLSVLTTAASTSLKRLYADAYEGALEIDASALRAVAEAYASRQKEFNQCFEARIKHPTEPANYKKVWNATLGSGKGLPLTSKQVSVKGVRMRRYFIDRDRAEHVLKTVATVSAF